MWGKLRLFYYLMRVLKNQSRYDYIEKFRRQLDAQGYFAESARFALEVSENRPLFAKKVLFRREECDMARLRSLPEGTLGREFAGFLDRYGLNVEFYKQVSSETDGGYIHRRILETHDIWHTVLEIPPDPLGEIKIQGFMYAQIHWPTAPFYIGVAMAGGMFKDPNLVPAFVDAAFSGYALGKRMKPLFAVRWEEEWEQPIADVRARLGYS